MNCNTMQYYSTVHAAHVNTRLALKVRKGRHLRHKLHVNLRLKYISVSFYSPPPHSKVLIRLAALKRYFDPGEEKKTMGWDVSHSLNPNAALKRKKA